MAFSNLAGCHKMVADSPAEFASSLKGGIAMHARTKLFSSICAISVLVIFAIYAYAQAPTDSDCVSAFSDSSASSSCGALDTCEDGEISYQCVDTSQIDATASSGQCKVSVYCMRINYSLYSPRHNTYNGSENQLKSLHNCDGVLKLDSC